MEHSKLEFQLAEACADLESRLRRGEREVAEVVFQAFPELKRDPEIAIEVVYAEFVVLCELGETPDAENVCKRFPELSKRILRLLKIHQAFSLHDETPLVKNTDSTLAGWFDEPGKTKVNQKIKSIGQYDLLEVIAHGGMGIVWKARQRGLGRIVAIKQIRDSLPNHEERRRFLAEAETAASLQHPNICQVYEVGTEDDDYFLSMEYVEGENLRDRIAKSSLSVYESCVLLEKVCRALEHAHQNSVVHRDLKPANILIDENGEPKVTDFGLAKTIGDDSHEHTRAGTILGTPAYMSPEQALGRTDEITPATDVHAIGVLLFELLTGRTPFKGQTDVETIRLVCESDPPSIRKLKPELAKDLDTICQRCLEKTPQNRYPTAGRVALELQRFLTDIPIEARSITMTERVWKWTRRHPAVASLMTMLFVAFVLGISGIAWQWKRAEREWQRAENDGLRLKQALTSSRKATEAESHALELSQRANYYQLIALVQSELANGDHAAARRILDQCPERFRGWEWTFLSDQCRLPILNIEHVNQNGRAVRYSPDNQRFAIAYGVWLSKVPGKVELRDIRTGGIQFILPGLDGPAQHVEFSPDGKTVTAACNRFDGRQSVGIVAWDVATGKRLESFQPSPGSAMCLDYRPNGKTILVGRSNGVVELIDSQTGVQHKKFGKHAGFALSVAFSPDDRFVASGGRDGVVNIWDANSGELLEQVTGLKDVRSIDFSPDGRQLAAGNYVGMVKIWNLKNPADNADSMLELACIHHQNSLGLSHVQYMPNARYLAVCSAIGGINLIDPVSGRLIMHCSPENTTTKFIDFSRDSKNFVFAGTNRTRFRRFESLSLDRYKVKRFIVSDLAWSPNSQLVALAGSEKTSKRQSNPGIVLVDAVTGNEVLYLEGFKNGLRKIEWNADGDRILVNDVHGNVFLCRKQQERWSFDSLELPAEFGKAHSAIFVGGRIALLSRQGNLCLNDLKTGLKTFSTGYREIAAIDESHLVAINHDQFIELLDAKSGQSLSRSRIPTNENELVDMVVSKHNNLVGFAFGREVFCVEVDTSDAQSLRLSLPFKLGSHLASVSSLAFDSTSTRMITSSTQDVSILWDVVAKIPAMRLSEPWERVDHVALSPVGPQMASTRGANLRLSEEWTVRDRGFESKMERGWISWHQQQMRQLDVGQFAFDFHERWWLKRSALQLKSLDQDDKIDFRLAYQLFEVGKRHAERGELEEAQRHLTAAKDIYLKLVDQFPRNLNYLFILSQIYKSLGERKAAIEYSRARAAKVRGIANMQSQHAWLIATLDKPTAEELSESIKFAQKAVELDPEKSSFWTTLGVTEFLSGNHEKARRSLLKAAKLSDGGTAFDHFLLAIIESENDPDSARRWYRRGIESMKSERNDREFLARLLSIARQKTESE